MYLRVALLQMASCGEDQEGNLRKGEDFCRRAAAMGADLALFPEMWNIGYTFSRPPLPQGQQQVNVMHDVWRAPRYWTAGSQDPEEALAEHIRRWQSLAVTEDSPFVRHFRQLAKELDMAIALTYLQAWEPAPRNVVSIIDRRGEILMTYAKVHTCDFGLPEWCTTPGEGFYACDLETREGEVRLGAMICYDREFPESARILMIEGAEVILTPNACDLEEHRLSQFKVRAFENSVAVAMANYAAPQMNGHSCAYHPVAFDAHGRSQDTTVVLAGEAEGVYLAQFDLDEIREYREREVWNNAFRRPHRYGKLVEQGVEPPFVRVNARGERYDPSKR
ncbi:Nitrilase/cyanide hydratase and apolipoprotein N- acyltransferase [Thermobaculum terrenum ATCC BAA-798]|uniref:Nitrilase/cyanide hydratase and apolipoprotein N-acyltransferase n=1 Tax=Thermobaculum terrenum (strain ATCC BAA-798 / CCMEE 7001 / YNP1) TaxID=525904 RepID=D1CIK5_THET1|nr:carbon-nitrogen hydrolase family protein [Thermobaculum terrenum]ACZ43576.1 Nitrilase/cyanide hydratase and apolipoprotein N- acyltransferase [Thermobaculum terrenum ATCC BAA-798]